MNINETIKSTIRSMRRERVDQLTELMAPNAVLDEAMTARAEGPYAIEGIDQYGDLVVDATHEFSPFGASAGVQLCMFYCREGVTILMYREVRDFQLITRLVRLGWGL